MTRNTTLLVLGLVIAAGLAGCTGSDADDGDNQPTGTPTPSPTPGPGTVIEDPPLPPDPTSKPLWNQTWEATDCDYAFAQVSVNGAALNEQVPAGYTTFEDSVMRYLWLYFIQCSALVVSNLTVIDDFQMGLVFTPIEPVTESSAVTEEEYLFELVVNNGSVARTLQDNGFDVQVGQIQYDIEATGGALGISSEISDYQATLGPFISPVEPFGVDRVELHHQGEGSTETRWIQLSSSYISGESYPPRNGLITLDSALGEAVAFANPSPATFGVERYHYRIGFGLITS